MTALLPGSIIIGTLGLLVVPWAPSGVLLAAAVTTPLLAAAPVLFVVRVRFFSLPVALATAGGTALVSGELVNSRRVLSWRLPA